MEKTLIAYTYRYFMETDQGISVKYLTGATSEHDAFIEKIKVDEGVKSSYREYVSQIDISLLMYTEEIKKEVKENEEVLS